MPDKKVYRTPETFVREYMKAYALGLTTIDLANRLGMRAASVYARASKFRKHGVKLPALKGVPKGYKIDVAKLNDLIKSKEY